MPPQLPILQNGQTTRKPNREYPAFNDHHHILILIGLEALPIQAHIHYVVTVCRPSCRSYRQNFFHVAIIAKIGGKDISIELDRDVAHSDSNSPVAFVFQLKPENLLVIVSTARFLARSSEGSRTSHNAKLHLQKYRHGMPAVFKRSSNVSFFSLANLLALKSDRMKDKVFCSAASTSSGIGRILSFSKYWAYLATLSFA